MDAGNHAATLLFERRKHLLTAEMKAALPLIWKPFGLDSMAPAPDGTEAFVLGSADNEPFRSPPPFEENLIEVTYLSSLSQVEPRRWDGRAAARRMIKGIISLDDLPFLRAQAVYDFIKPAADERHMPVHILQGVVSDRKAAADRNAAIYFYLPAPAGR
jgi:hypothetical protein